MCAKVSKIISHGVLFLLISLLLIPSNATALNKEALYEKIAGKLDVEENVFFTLKDDCIYTYLSEEWKNDAQLASVFGGMYYEKDKLVYLIKMIKETKEESAKVSDIFDSILLTEKYATQGVKYSYKELFDTKEKLANEVFGGKIPFGERKGMRMPFTITGVGLNDSINSVVVYIQSLSEEKIQWFKKNISDSDIFAFEAADEEITLMATLYPGQGLVRATNQTGLQGNISMGFPAIKGSNVYFVTCAHTSPTGGAVSAGAVVYNGSTPIGITTLPVYSGDLDCSLVQVYTGNTVSSKIYNSSHNIAYSYFLNPGLKKEIAKVGGATGVTIGNVYDTSHNGTYDGHYFTNLTMAIRQSTSYTMIKRGDSGGLVYTGQNSLKVVAGITAVGSSEVVGICKGTRIKSNYGL